MEETFCLVYFCLVFVLCNGLQVPKVRSCFSFVAVCWLCFVVFGMAICPTFVEETFGSLFAITPKLSDYGIAGVSSSVLELLGVVV